MRTLRSLTYKVSRKAPRMCVDGIDQVFRVVVVAETTFFNARQPVSVVCITPSRSAKYATQMFHWDDAILHFDELLAIMHHRVVHGLPVTCSVQGL